MRGSSRRAAPVAALIQCECSKPPYRECSDLEGGIMLGPAGLLALFSVWPLLSSHLPTMGQLFSVSPFAPFGSELPLYSRRLARIGDICCKSEKTSTHSFALLGIENGWPCGYIGYFQVRGSDDVSQVVDLFSKEGNNFQFNCQSDVSE